RALRRGPVARLCGVRSIIGARAATGGRVGADGQLSFATLRGSVRCLTLLRSVANRLSFVSFHQLAQPLGQFFIGGRRPPELRRRLETAFARKRRRRHRAQRKETEDLAPLPQLERGYLRQVGRVERPRGEQRRPVGY